MARRVQILALSGGGFLGLYTAEMLAHLEEAAGRPLGRCFDLICGTSVGGILATALAHEVPAGAARAAFLRHGSRIFPRRRRGLLRALRGPLYDHAPLRAALIEMIGAERRLIEARHRLLVTAADLSSGSARFFRTPHHPDHRADRRLRSVDVALATASAPVMFPLVEIAGALHCDGGLYATAPDMIGLHEALGFLGADLAEIHVLSIGNSSAAFHLPRGTGPRLGLLHWARDNRLILLTAAVQQSATARVLTSLLGTRYLRLDSVPTPRQRMLARRNDMATPAAQQTLLALAGEAFAAARGDARLAAILGHEAPPPAFIDAAQ